MIKKLFIVAAFLCLLPVISFALNGSSSGHKDDAPLTIAAARKLGLSADDLFGVNKGGAGSPEKTTDCSLGQKESGGSCVACSSTERCETCPSSTPYYSADRNACMACIYDNQCTAGNLCAGGSTNKTCQPCSYGQTDCPTCPSGQIADGAGSCISGSCPSGYSTSVTTCAEGYTKETSGTSGGLSCNKCVASACPSGYSTGITCTAGYTTETSGTSGGLPCKRCVGLTCGNGGYANAKEIGTTMPVCSTLSEWQVITTGKSGDATCYACVCKGSTFGGGGCCSGGKVTCGGTEGPCRECCNNNTATCGAGKKCTNYTCGNCSAGETCFCATGTVSNGSGGCVACAAGTYYTSSGCTACPTGCATCTSATSCQTCQTGYTLSNGKCVAGKSCTTQANCNVGEECLSGYCKTCGQGSSTKPFCNQGGSSGSNQGSNTGGSGSGTTNPYCTNCWTSSSAPTGYTCDCSSNATYWKKCSSGSNQIKGYCNCPSGTFSNGNGGCVSCSSSTPGCTR